MMKTIKVEKTSADCAKYNQLNAEAIAAGLMDAIEPSDRQLGYEKAEARRQMVENAINNGKQAILEALGKTEVTIEIRPTYSDSFYSSSKTGWRIYFGERFCRDSQRSWAQLGMDSRTGAPTMNVKQLGKAQEKLKIAEQRLAAKNAKENAERAALSRYQALIKTEGGRKLVFSLCGYVSEYGYEGLTVNADDRITYKYETFTLAQWLKIIALRDEQTKAMVTLKQSFKAA